MKVTPIATLQIFAIIVFSSCSPRIFLPDRVNSPMLKEAGEVKLISSVKLQSNTQASGLGLSSSFDLAGSPINHLGLIVSYRNTNKFSNDADWFDGFGSSARQDSVHYSGKRYEFGAGYFMAFGAKGVFECYGGGAVGTINRENLRDRINGANYQAKYYRIFLQPAVGFNHNDIVEINGGIRFAYQSYTDFVSDDASLRYHFTNPNSDITKTTFYFIEPFVNFQFGYKYVKFNLQPGFANSVTSPRLSSGSPFYLSMGITLQIAPRFWQ